MTHVLTGKTATLRFHACTKPRPGETSPDNQALIDAAVSVLTEAAGVCKERLGRVSNIELGTNGRDVVLAITGELP